MILLDWNQGKIPFYTVPPKRTGMLQCEIKNEFSSEFLIDGFGNESVDQVMDVGMEQEHVVDGMYQEHVVDGMEQEHVVGNKYFLLIKFQNLLIVLGG